MHGMQAATIPLPTAGKQNDHSRQFMPELKPYSSPTVRARTRVRATAVAATATPRVTYLAPSAAKALKKVGPAWMPTERMNAANPKLLAPVGALNPKCPDSRPTCRMLITGSGRMPAIRMFANRYPSPMTVKINRTGFSRS